MTEFETLLLERVEAQSRRIEELSEKVESLAALRQPRPEILTVKQAAAELQCAPATVLDLVHRKVLKILPRRKLPGVGRGKRGSPIKIKRSSLDAYKGLCAFMNT